MAVLRRTQDRFSLIAVGGLSLALGVWEYLTGRHGNVYFLKPFEPAADYFRQFSSPFGPFAQVAPDFFHPLGFALISMAVAPEGRRWRTGICLGWLVLEWVFEVGQACGRFIAGRLPGWFEGIPVLDHLDDYFRRGSFDPADLVAMACGCAAAWTIAELVQLFGLRPNRSLKTTQ